MAAEFIGAFRCTGPGFTTRVQLFRVFFLLLFFFRVFLSPFMPFMPTETLNYCRDNFSLYDSFINFTGL